MMKKFYIEMLGCPMRAVEGQRLKRYFIMNGFKEVMNKEQADLVAVFTCSVVDETEATTISLIDSIDKSSKRVILLGCSPGISPKTLKDKFGLEMIATKDMEEQIDDLFPQFKIKFNDIPLPTEFNKDYEYGKYYFSQFKNYGRKKFFSKTKKPPALMVSSKGCNNNCSYCTMRRALGPVKSYSHEIIRNNYKKLRENGTDVIVFLADDTGAYGIDQGETFADLLDFCYQIESELNKGKVTWIIDSLHPFWAIRFQDTIAKYIKNKTISEITMPLQSASDSILKLMRRKHTMKDVETCLKKFKEADSGLVLKTHFIIGFPSETQADIECVERMLKQRYFDYIIFLKYFEGENSESAKIQGKVAPELANSRVESLVELTKTLKLDYYIAGTVF
jgi:MiaB/RimO family radical SAM methylthiotransferase